ncbi:hypothetical protein OKW23_001315 [Bacilli bacterium PM5-9]|nr:hypothetical protein [Bacilli bacterium PM5-9]
MENIFSFKGNLFKYCSNRLEIYKDDNLVQQFYYTEIVSIEFKDAQGGLFSKDKECSLIIKTTNGDLELEFEKKYDNICDNIAKYYNKYIDSEYGKVSAYYNVVHLLGIEDRIQKNTVIRLSICEDKLLFNKNKSIKFSEIKNVELVDHMQFMHSVSIASTMILGDFAPSAGSKDELMIIEMIVITFKEKDKLKKVVVSQSKESQDDLESICNTIKSACK